MATSRQREHAAALMRWLLTLEPKIGYVQRRPMDSRFVTEQQLETLFARTSFVGSTALSLDCSEMATLICRLTGMASPSGPSFPYSSGAGNTQTMAAFLPRYTDASLANVGALVVFGVDASLDKQHVATVMGPGADPWLFSHGSSSGPKRLRFSTELAAQKRIHGDHAYAFLNVSGL